MSASLADGRDTVAPARGSKDGLLPPLAGRCERLLGATARKLAVPDLTTTVFPVALLILVAVAAMTFMRSGSEPGSAA